MLIELTDRDAIRSYLRAVRREQLRARVLGDEDRVGHLLAAQAIAVDAGPEDHYSAVAAPLDYMLSLLDRPQLRDRVSRVAIDLAVLDERGRELLTGVLARLGAVDRLRSPRAQA
jgi:hypothetical protein